MNRAAVLAAVLAEHADCALNEDPYSLGAGTTGEDVWSCGITLPFSEDLEDAERAHVAAALDAALAQEGDQGEAWAVTLCNWLTSAGEAPLDFGGHPIPVRLRDLLERAFAPQAGATP